MFERKYSYSLRTKKKEQVGELTRIVHLFRFTTSSNRKIITEAHLFDEHPLVVIKFFDKNHRLSSNRFSLMSSSNEASAIIRTVIEIMLDFHRKNPYISFAFMGAPDSDGNLNNNKRFRIYKGIMSRLFSNVSFEHLQLEVKSLYILLNRDYCNNKQECSQGIFDLLAMSYPDEWDTQSI
jgi:hypothetical protein